MPNWCSNSIVVTGKKGIIDLILTKVNLIQFDEVKENTRIGVFEELIGLGNIDRDKYDGGEWYDHNHNRFGTKWDISKDDFLDSLDDWQDGEEAGFSTHFNTAWSPPKAFIENFTKEYGVEVEMDSEEGGNDFYFKGKCIDGEWVIHDSLDFGEGQYTYNEEYFWEGYLMWNIESLWEEYGATIDGTIIDGEDYAGAIKQIKKDYSYCSDKDIQEIIKMYDEYRKDELDKIAEEKKKKEETLTTP
jgi:hypothetical protein